jgi:thioesterase domain-containing protein
VANDVIRRNFRPKPYEGDAVLFQAELPATKHPDVHLGWRNLIKGGVDIRPVPGRHFDFLKEPHVRRLAEELADCLAERQERHSLDTQKPDTGR